MSKEVTSGIIALREHMKKPILIEEGGDKFYFKKLVVADDDAIRNIIQSHQDTTLKPPEEPKPAEGEEDVTAEVRDGYFKAVDDFSEKTDKLFRRLTCALMKYILTDSKGNKLFDEDDDIYDLVNNVYAKNFFGAYTRFKNGNFGGVAEAEKRFQS